MMGNIAFQTADTYHLRCQERTQDSACDVLSVYRAGDSLSPILYPAPELLLSVDALPTLYADDISPIFPTTGNHLTVFVSVDVNDIPIINQEHYQNSSLVFANPSPLHTSTLDVSFLESISIGDLEILPPVDCNFNNFQPVYQVMTYFQNLLKAIQSNQPFDSIPENFLGINAQTAGVWSYIMLWTREWGSCYENALSFQTFGDRVTPIENTTLCTDNNLDDPCCNPQLQWSECCSAENRDVIEIESAPQFINEESLEDQCQNPSCMKTFSEDFRELFLNDVSDQVCIVNDEIGSNITSLFQFCTSKYIGEQPLFGVACSSDEDCDFLEDPNGYCDIKTSKCVTDPELREDAFLNCLIENMNSLTKTLVYLRIFNLGFANPNNVSGDDFLTVEVLKGYALAEHLHCFDDYGPLYDHHEYFTLSGLPISGSSTCPICDVAGTEFFDMRCLTTFACEAPIQCGDVSETCLSNFIVLEPECEEPTQDDYVCNWNNNITNEGECEEEEYRCMYCFNSTFCASSDTISSEEECENTPICLLENGEVLWGVGGEECERREGCSVGGEAVDEDECARGEYCEDPDFILKSIEALLPNFQAIETALNGVCITPLSPFNTPACPLLRRFSLTNLDFATQRGCVRLGQCFNVNNVTIVCPQDPATPEACVRDYGGTWLNLPIDNQQDCENPRGVDEEDYPGYCKLNNRTQYLSPQNKDDCESCGGYPTPPAQWRPPTFGGGTTLQPSWRKTEMVPLYQTSSNSISFVRLETLFDQVRINYQTFIFWSGQSCLIYPFVNLLDIFSCDCPTAEPSNNFNNPLNNFPFETVTCDESNEDDDIGTIWFCPTSDYQLGIITGTVTSLNEFVSGELCFSSDITLASTSLFVGNRPSEAVTVTNDPNELDPSPVRNQKGASVGYVLGDGIRFELSANIIPVDFNDQVQGVQLTFSIERSAFDGIPDWYVLDFGLEVVDESLKTQPNDEIELWPVGATIGLTIGDEIGDLLNLDLTHVRVDGVLPDPFRYEKAARVYPIARLPDWESEDEDEALSTGEKAMTGVFAGLYGIAFFVTIFFLIQGASSLTLSLLILFFYVLATFGFRTAFWAIVASGNYEETSDSYFILIEPPSYFILSVLTILIMSYAFIVAASKGSENLGFYWLAWFLLQIFLISVLFVVVGLMIGLDTDDDITIFCFGRQSSVEENNTIRNLRIAYHSCLLFVAIICAGIVLFLGQQLPDGENKSTLQILSALAGLAVVLTSILWVTYSVIDEPSPYFVIPLFFTEVPPLLLVGYLMFHSNSDEGYGGEAQNFDL